MNDRQILDFLDSWKYVLGPAIVAVAGALVTAVGYITKRFCKGATYYTGKAWELAEMMARKHIDFVDSVSSELVKQTDCLERVESNTDQTKEHTESTSKAISALGSDPLKLVDAVKDQIVNAMIEAMAAQGCKYDPEEMKANAERILKQYRTRNKAGASKKDEGEE